MSELGLIAPLGGLVVIALFYMRRISEGAAATAWGGAWLALYLAGLLASLPHTPPPLLAASGHVLGTLFVALLYAGAVSFRDGGPLPRAPVWIGLAIGVFRGALLVAGHNPLALALAVPLELPFAVGAAVVTWRAARGRRSFPEQLLPPTLALLAVVNAADPIARSIGLDLVPIVLAWTTTAFATSLLQIAVFVERGRDRERQLLLERNLLYRVARAGTESRARKPAIDAVALAVAEAQWFDVFGIWLASADGKTFDRAARMRVEANPDARFDRFPADAPLLQKILASEDLVLIAERGSRSARFRNFGLGDVAALTLRVHGRALGVVIGGLSPDRCFGEAERRVLGSITRELALVLAHVDAVEERERQAVALAAERRLLRALVEAVPVGILLADRDERITMLSRVGADHFEIGDPESWTGRPVLDTVHAYAHRLCPESAARLAADLAKQETDRFDGFEMRFAKPEERVLVVSARPVASNEGERLGRVLVSLDVTEERRVSDRLQRAQRMETLGMLASGIAHDFNNQLTAILGNARVLATSLPPAPGPRDALADLEAAAEHCAELTRGLLDLARQAPMAPQAVAVDKLLREVEALLRASLAPDVRLRVDAAPDLYAEADPGQLRRVLTNLALNARDAVGAHGEIELLAARTTGPAGDLPCLELCVRDSGVGMDPRTLERVFDPFFTTKPAGQGTGLGLAIVYRIVEAHGASIEVDSEPGRGTQFRVRWPIATGQPRATLPGARDAAGGHECVLLAEDEPAVRRLSRAALERRGYRVLEASDGDEAVALFDRHRDAVDLLVLDLAMPRRGGLEVLEAVRAKAPALRAVLMSGHGSLEHDGALPERVVALVKPFRPDELAGAVRRALDSIPIA